MITTGSKVLVNSFTVGKESDLETITGEKVKVGAYMTCCCICWLAWTKWTSEADLVIVSVALSLHYPACVTEQKMHCLDLLSPH